MNQELINRAHELRDHGFTTGEIADELNVSMETARWLSLQRPEEKTVEQAPADIAINWEIILKTVYQHKKKIPLLLKAGMGMDILDQINSGIEAVPDQFKLRIAVWSGIIFNAVGIWAVSGFKRPLEQMPAELTEITMHLYDSEVAAAFDPHI